MKSVDWDEQHYYLGEIVKKVEQEREWQKHEDERRHVLYDMLDKELPRWKEKYYPLIGLERNLTPEVRKKIEGFLENLGNKSDSDDYDDDD